MATSTCAFFRKHVAKSYPFIEWIGVKIKSQKFQNKHGEKQYPRNFNLQKSKKK